MDGGGIVYFMKATEASPGRGPLSREELVEALIPDLIRQTATIRAENDDACERDARRVNS